MIGIFVDTRLSLFRIAGTIVRTRIGCLEIHADCRVDVVWLAYRADFSAGSNREGDNDRGRSRPCDSDSRARVHRGYGYSVHLNGATYCAI